jgi:hypothetical protein
MTRNGFLIANGFWCMYRTCGDVVSLTTDTVWPSRCDSFRVAV